MVRETATLLLSNNEQLGQHKPANRPDNADINNNDFVDKHIEATARDEVVAAFNDWKC
jgi:hypothetical protein